MELNLGSEKYIPDDESTIDLDTKAIHEKYQYRYQELFEKLSKIESIAKEKYLAKLNEENKTKMETIQVSKEVYWGIWYIEHMLLKNSSQQPKQAYSDIYYPNALVWAEEYPKEFVGILKGNIKISIKPDKAKVFVDEHIYDCLMSMSIEDNLKHFNVKYNTPEYKDALEWINQFPMTYTDVLLGRAELIKNQELNNNK